MGSGNHGVCVFVCLMLNMDVSINYYCVLSLGSHGACTYQHVEIWGKVQLTAPFLGRIILNLASFFSSSFLLTYPSAALSLFRAATLQVGVVRPAWLEKKEITVKLLRLCQ